MRSSSGTARLLPATSSSPRRLQAGSTGAPGARGALLTLIDDKTQPAIVRASAIARLGRWMTPSMVPAVTRGLNDPDAVVRLASVEALATTDPATRQRYLTRMLGDPVRAVRIEAARALAGPAESGLASDGPGALRIGFDGVHRGANLQRRSSRRARCLGQSVRDPRQRRGRDRRVPKGDRARSDLRARVRQSRRPVSRARRRQRSGEGLA